MPEWPKGTGCKPVGSAFAGSNPARPTIRLPAPGPSVGRALLTEVLDIAATRGFHAVMARVVGGHETSIGLHESLGFRVVGTEVEVGRKFGKWLDVVLLQKML